MDDIWFDEFIQRAQSPVKIRNITGEELLIKISQELLRFLMENRYLIIKIGKDKFQEFLKLAADNKVFDALVKIYENVSNANLIAQYQGNAVMLAEIAVQLEQERKFWMDFLMQIGGKMVGIALSTLVGGI